MKTRKTIFLVAGYLLQLCISLPGTAQLARDTNIIRPLPKITGWADNTHYIVEKWNTASRKYLAATVDIETGTEKKYTARQALSYKVEVSDGDIYLFSEQTRKRLTNTKAAEKLPLLSPDKKWVAFIRNNDLFSVEIATGKEIRYTSDGSETIMNGYASWVYYEEIFGRASKYRAFWWSPDSRHLAFYRFDDGGVPVFPLYNVSGQHGAVELTRYPKAGDPNPEVKVGIVPVVGGGALWADFNQKEDQYFGTPFWRPDGSGLLVQWMPRDQNNLKLYEIDPISGSKKEIYNEQQATWINWIGTIRWVRDGFLIVRDFDGWEQIYYHGKDGRLKYKLTSGKNWNTGIIRVDERTQTVYYRSDAELSTRTDLYSVRMNGKQQKRLTFGNFTHDDLLLSPDARYLITRYSNAETPVRIALINLRNGKIREIADSKGRSFDSAALEKREIVWLKTADGFDLPGRITWPKNREVGRKYPVVISIYGGPGHQSVSDGFVNPLFSDNDSDMIRVGFDHRGSGHCGKKGLNYLYRSLGKWEMEDYIAWVKWLRKNPHVDPDKILITGGSYGGYLTALALSYGAEYFKYGIANYPVTDWVLYDSHYTERYMDQPKDNPEGYKFGSVLTHASNYQSHGPSMLLLQHGTMDDNVHIQNTYQLVDALQKLNKPFELMVYPGERHGWLGPKVPFTVSMRNRFLQKYLFGRDG